MIFQFNTIGIKNFFEVISLKKLIFAEKPIQIKVIRIY